MQKFRAEQDKQTPQLWQAIRRPVHHSHGETGRRRSKRAGESLRSGVGKEQVGKGGAMRLERVCFIRASMRLCGEKRPEKCKAFDWLNSPAVPGILSCFYLVLKKTLHMLKVFVVCQC